MSKEDNNNIEEAKLKEPNLTSDANPYQQVFLFSSYYFDIFDIIWGGLNLLDLY